MVNYDDELKELLNIDPVAEADKLGVAGEEVGFLGLALQFKLNAAKKDMANKTNDVSFDCTTSQWLKVVEDLGFSKIYDEIIPARAYDTQDGDDRFLIFWRKDGLLLKAETYGVVRINSANLYYNWTPNSIDSTYIAGHNGGCPMRHYMIRANEEYRTGVRNVYPQSGSVDARDFIRFKINQIKKAGSLMPKWEERPFLWLVNWAEKENEKYDYNEINDRKISQLPAHVRCAITPKSI